MKGRESYIAFNPLHWFNLYLLQAERALISLLKHFETATDTLSRAILELPSPTLLSIRLSERQGIVYSFQPFTLAQFKSIASEKRFDIIAQAF